MDNFPFRKSAWRKRQLQQQEYKTETDIEAAALIVASIIGVTGAVLLALFFTFSWLD